MSGKRQKYAQSRACLIGDQPRSRNLLNRVVNKQGSCIYVISHAILIPLSRVIVTIFFFFFFFYLPISTSNTPTLNLHTSTHHFNIHPSILPSSIYCGHYTPEQSSPYLPTHLPTSPYFPFSLPYLQEEQSNQQPTTNKQQPQA